LHAGILFEDLLFIYKKLFNPLKMSKNDKEETWLRRMAAHLRKDQPSEDGPDEDFADAQDADPEASGAGGPPASEGSEKRKKKRKKKDGCGCVLLLIFIVAAIVGWFIGCL
jgi:hypothetical protein